MERVFTDGEVPGTYGGGGIQLPFVHLQNLVVQGYRLRGFSRRMETLLFTCRAYTDPFGRKMAVLMLRPRSTGCSASVRI
ncbi:UNVERIFIED_CONTAM: hypothetical protein PYX00_000908 [Menopon gallinae]|uniref:Uncharacterized protein n=1 Tax=Menopon gallinae TaxID=328185 RepID=A0AAW2IAY1_9NEOP